MLNTLRTALLLSVVFAYPSAVSAGPIYDFGSSSGTVTDLGSSELLPGGIVAYAFVYTNSLTGWGWAPSTLIGRNEGPEDVGLGVCSEGSDKCAIGGTGSGDNNELSQLVATEAILLQRPSEALWSGLWLSSLDAGGTNNSERGQLYWTNEDGTSLSGPFNFGYPEFDGVNAFGKLLLPAEFDQSALYLLFMPGGALGENNDYLVWGADLEIANEASLGNEASLNVVPEPGTLTLALLGAGVWGLIQGPRRSKRRDIVQQP